MATWETTCAICGGPVSSSQDLVPVEVTPDGYKTVAHSECWFPDFQPRSPESIEMDRCMTEAVEAEAERLQKEAYLENAQ